MTILTDNLSLSKEALKMLFASYGKSNSGSVVIGDSSYSAGRLVVDSFRGSRGDDSLWHGTVTFTVDGESAETTDFDFLDTGANDNGSDTFSD